MLRESTAPIIERSRERSREGSRFSSLLSRYAVLSGANLLAMAMGFAVVLLVAGPFGPGGLGKVSLAFSLTAYALILAVCGTDLYAVRQVAAAPRAVGATAGSVIAVRWAAGSIAYAALLAVALAVPSYRETFSLVAWAGLSLFAMVFHLGWVAQGLHRTHVVAAANLAAASLYLLFVLLALGMGAGLWSIAASKVAADGAVAAGLVLWMRRSVGRIEPPSGWAPLWRMARSASPVAGTQLLRAAALGSDLVLLGLMVRPEELGVYSAASRIFMLALSVITAYFVILLPRIAERAGQPGPALSEELNGSLRRVVPAALAGALLLISGARPLLLLLFGPAFVGAALSLQLLSGALVANLAGRHYQQVLLARGRQTTDFRVSGAVAAVHLVAKAALIPLFGIAGAAAGTLLGEAFLMAGQWWAARPELAGAGEESAAEA
ncbi:MAG TPA: oligosaccharide flippase family protein [Thermoanaerobaculia bacterium]|nr:oligosaccharide flippase family protein [Thermoanaerobaculia bacterium]